MCSIRSHHYASAGLLQQGRLNWVLKSVNLIRALTWNKNLKCCTTLPSTTRFPRYVLTGFHYLTTRYVCKSSSCPLVRNLVSSADWITMPYDLFPSMCSRVQTNWFWDIYLVVVRWKRLHTQLFENTFNFLDKLVITIVIAVYTPFTLYKIELIIK